LVKTWVAEVSGQTPILPVVYPETLAEGMFAGLLDPGRDD